MGLELPSTMNHNCPFQNECWRLAYSKYYRETGNEDCPTRGAMYFLDYASDEMVKSKRSGVYCENFPSPNGNNFCPEMNRGDYRSCHEYVKHTKRVAIATKKKEYYEKRYKQRHNRKPISKDDRHTVAMKSKYSCVYCGDHISKFKRRGAKGTIDHLIPLNKNGKDEIGNMVYACSSCNYAKQDELWEKGCRKGYYDTAIAR